MSRMSIAKGSLVFLIATGGALGCTASLGEGGGEGGGEERGGKGREAGDGSDGEVHGGVKAELCDPDALPDATASLLLTRSQLLNSLEALLGDLPLVESDLPPDTQSSTFVHAATHRAGSDWVRQLTLAAPVAAQAAVARGVDSLLPCDVDSFDADCASLFLRGFLAKAFRRVPTPEEVERYAAFLNAQELAYGLDEGLAMVIEATILSAPFLYRFEQELEEGLEPGLALLDSHSIAVRLSYLLTGGPPDETLAQAARRGELVDADALENQAIRLLGEPDASGAVLFFENWFGLDFELITKGAELLDGAADQADLNAGWRSMFAGAVRTNVAEGGPLEELLTSAELDVPENLSHLYPAGEPRSGLLTQPGVLAALSHDHSSPVLRGVFVRDHLLCQPVPPPPPGVEANIPERKVATSTRERYANLEESPGCQTCHELIHGVGFGLEEYDALGRFRTHEEGVEVDATGSLFGFHDAGLSGEFDGAQELGEAIAGSEQFTECLTANLYEAALARPLAGYDACQVEEIAEFGAPESSAASFSSLVIALVRSPAFSRRVKSQEVSQ